ncbi:MAG: phosphatidylinositol-specific phospholipase C [Proteiniphilum sp.]|nr:phosphatidylinositol-specific phospholipase C [Proteiniphilum sp.]MDD3908377.1 phosphatidylinositol-specific phospholipase C [Proteiniphilum sp.]MDD4415784.1 phosphatidylinositol-specific phospholipase C [Proteiniphilum sp.]
MKPITFLLLILCLTACCNLQPVETKKPEAKTHSSYPLSAWMTHVPNNTLVAKLSLPGTHDTGAYVTGGPMIITQDLSVEQQLKAGIRAMDIRLVAMNNTHLEIFHGIAAQNLNFETDVLQEVISFLRQNPSETIVITLRKELDDRNSPRGYVALLREILEKAEYVHYIINDFKENMTLAEARGKILFISRNDLGTPIIGGVFSGWPDNTTFTRNIIGTQATTKVHVEDYYQVGTILRKDINKKRNAIYQNLVMASENTNANYDWFITFTSGTGAGAYPNAVADRVNKPVAEYIVKNNLASCGIVLMDFAGTPSGRQLIEAIIETNKGLRP